MHHTVAFGIASLGTTANTTIPALTDDMLTIRNNAFFMDRQTRLLYAYFGSTDAVRARLSTPTWRTIAQPQLRPVSSAILPPSPSAVVDYRKDPLVIPSEQEFAMEGTDNSGGDVAMGVAGVQIRDTPAPARNIYTIRASSSSTAVARTWTTITSTYDDDLPPGTYHVVGMNHISTTGVSARLILSGEFYRPGCVSQATADTPADKMFSKGGLGSWGTFDNTTLPQVQVMCTDADSSHVIFLDISKV